MSDVDGNMDNPEMTAHLIEERQPFSAGIDATYALRNYELSDRGKAVQVAIAKAAHSCDACRSFAGNPPAPED